MSAESLCGFCWKPFKVETCDFGKCITRVHNEMKALKEEVASLKESLRDVLEISEVEGAVNLTTMESAKLMAARTLLGPESRFAQGNHR